jgi:heat shock protein HslJ
MTHRPAKEALMSRHVLSADMLLIGALVGTLQCSAPPKAAAPLPAADSSTSPELGGTAWRLVKFQGGDETVLTPDDPAKYTLAFEPDGRLGARIDCNRGASTWKSSPPQLELGALALTRAMCPPGSFHDQIVKQWPYVRSYVVRDGHLFLSLVADGGIYEFEPMSSDQSMTGTGGSLENTYWKLMQLGETQDGGSVVARFEARHME